MPASSSSLQISNQNLHPSSAIRPLSTSMSFNYQSRPAQDYSDILCGFPSLSLSTRSTSECLTVPSKLAFRQPLATVMSQHPDVSPPHTLSPGDCTLEAPFSMSYNYSSKKLVDDREMPTIIDSFVPRPLALDLSPISSASSDFGSVASSNSLSLARSSVDAFVTTRSRVVRVRPIILVDCCCRTN